jgi:hypothetical protein
MWAANLIRSFTLWRTMKADVHGWCFGTGTSGICMNTRLIMTLEEMKMAEIGTGTTNYDNSTDSYPALEQVIKDRFSSSVAQGTPLFTTNVEGLFDHFLNYLPSEARQHYRCRACETFVNRFGGLVTLSEDGEMTPIMWDFDNTPEFFLPAVNAMIYEIRRAKVTGVFLSEDRTWGTPRTVEWSHMAVSPLPGMVYKSRLETAGQKMAEKREEYRMLQHAIQEYTLPTIQQAVALLKGEALYRSEKTLGVAEWFMALYTERGTTKNQRSRDNKVWLAVATAPNGFTHVRSSMIGTLLDDIQSGMDFGSVKKRFADKMHPLQYQRPQAAPTSGNIAEAEKIVEKLGIAPSLERRFARLDEIETIWTPALPKGGEAPGGVFGHLKTKNAQPATPMMALPAVTMTWRKFLETVLPTAEAIEYAIKSKDSFAAILTAEHEDAPPILQWDQEDRRNPFSWYVYHGGSTPQQWNVSPGWNKVTGIAYQPSMWHEANEYQGTSVTFTIDGAKDTYKRARNTGNALFPETLKADLRAVRSTIEAYSKSAQLGGYEEASACGIRLQYGKNWNAEIRVTTAMGTTIYKLDRWD